MDSKVTLREAAQQALEALEHENTMVDRGDGHWEFKHDLAAAALRAALAEPTVLPSDCADSHQPVQEPVAWQWLNSGHFRKKRPVKTANEWRPLYTVPLNLNDPAVQKRLAAQWGYVKAEPIHCAYPNCLGGTVGTFCHNACIKKDGHARTTD